MRKSKPIKGSLIKPKELNAILKRAAFERQQKLSAQEIANDLEAINNRARSVSVGTAFGGAVDLTLRRPNGVCTYAILQPVEAIELLHQLAAAVGCHIHVQPRNDFSSWREWRHIEAGAHHTSNNGHPPPPDFLPDNKVKARELMPPEQQPGMNANVMALNKSKKLQEK